ncbi:four helix bundle protein [Oscillatoria sp. FACHB-1407]|uniref:four helix bundle protein n=1 Tax=Oscillatoria sp. FACHB-1407 TaxID=2692847 RepID=UPI001682701F|nr:four helix bundle protein [Oscillatoria sp. FACHB-1407]MBD2463490.1 four helix bundle protein [Oscillatoria sp. FACHB-1407]
MGKLESYRDLEAWKVSMRLAKEVYQATEVIPKHEIYGLTSQIRRACVSVPTNMAEGYGRNHRKELYESAGRLLNRLLQSLQRRIDTP